MKEEIADLRYILSRKTGLGPADVKAKIVNPSTVNVTIGANSVNKSSMADDSIGVNETDYETATLAFASGDTVKTATVSSGSIIVGVYASTVTGNPASHSIQLGVSSTTLTGTLSAAPGGATAITYTIFLLKV